MATDKSFGQLICKCERCDKTWKARDNKMPKACRYCKSEEWNKPQAKVLTEDKMKPAALQCAIVYQFDCGFFRDKEPATALCKVCFKLAIWKKKALQKNLLEMVEEGNGNMPEIEKKEIQDEPIDPEDVYRKMAKADELPTPKDFKQEDGLPPIVGGEKKKKERKDTEKFQMTANARTCSNKLLDNEGKWNCNFFTHKTNNPPYPYCRRCWELVEVWGERAVGQ